MDLVLSLCCCIIQVPQEFKEVLDDTVVTALSHYSPLVIFSLLISLDALLFLCHKGFILVCRGIEDFSFIFLLASIFFD